MSLLNMSLILNYEEFQNICRTCLFIGKLRPIIDSVVIEIIRGISGVEVKNDADLPQKICESCYKKIYKINEFALQCKRNEISLNNCKTEYFERKKNETQSINIKEEIITEDDMLQIKQELNTEDVSNPIEFIDVPGQNTTQCSTTEESNNETNLLRKNVVFKCDVCSKKFKESCELVEHRRTHKKQFPYKCNVCDKPIRHKATLNRHKLFHKKQKPQCNVCFKIFFDLKALRIHRCIQSFVCKICHKKFSGAHFLRRHHRLEHPAEDVDDLDLATRCKLKKTPEITVEPDKEDDARLLGNEAGFEEVVVKSEATDMMTRESDKNILDLFEAVIAKTKYENNEQHKDETQNENLLNTDEMEFESQIDPQNLLMLNEEPSCSSFIADKMDTNRYDPFYSSIDNNIDGNKSPTNSNNNCIIDGKRSRDRNFCMFCKTTVLNFVRHITRNHLKEPEVKKVLSSPVGSKERKDLLSLLRKRGNYMLNVKKCTKPVKKTKVAKKFLPCVYCLGFYSTRQLWKHRKVCIANLSPRGGADGAQMSRPSAEAQNLLVQHLRLDETLRGVVFPRMRADDVSLVAKSDALICAFGARYIKAHEPEKHVVNVTSRKMRELAKLLIVLKDLDPSIRTLFEALNTKCYALVVSAVKVVANYDEASNTFASPTYALQIGTSLKQCCEIALTEDNVFDFILADVLKEEVRNFIQLLESNWKLVIPPPIDHLKHLNLDLDLDCMDAETTAPTSASVKTVKEKSVQNNSCDINKKRVLVPWTPEQKRVVDEHFKEHIAKKQAPKKTECEALIQTHSLLLQNKNWLKIKVYVQNKYSK